MTKTDNGEDLLANTAIASHNRAYECSQWYKRLLVFNAYQRVPTVDNVDCFIVDNGGIWQCSGYRVEKDYAELLLVKGEQYAWCSLDAIQRCIALNMVSKVYA